MAGWNIVGFATGFHPGFVDKEFGKPMSRRRYLWRRTGRVP